MRLAWEELVFIQKEQERYSGIKLDLEQDLGECKKQGARLEDVSFFPLKGDSVWKCAKNFNPSFEKSLQLF